jgi:2-dehydropantoate 2-reductase
MALRFAILGAGGLGCVVGGCLAESGAEVSLVARPQHVRALRERGLAISGLRGERVVRERLDACEHAGELRGDFDCVILAVKHRDTETALAEAAPLRDRIGAALSLQNAFGKNDALAAAFGAGRVLGAATTEAGVLTGPGAVCHVGSAPVAFYFGEPDGASSRRLTALVDAFQKAGMGARAAADIRHVETEKLLQIASLAAFTTSLFGLAPRGSVAEGMASQHGAEHYVAIATELLAAYRSFGYEPQDFFAPYARFRELAAADFESAVASTLALGRQMLEAGVIGRPSLHVDLIAGRPTEVEVQLAPFLAQAERKGLAVPTARAAYRIIRTLETLPRA